MLFNFIWVYWKLVLFKTLNLAENYSGMNVLIICYMWKEMFFSI